ncbi:MAG: rhodanese-like domain-containing protein [Candidatus Poribacteria bacterium]|nr:rhodanese-like domain-containing protein [Candidatus Poribacteria bacterium]
MSSRVTLRPHHEPPDDSLIADARQPAAYMAQHIPGAIPLFWGVFLDRMTRTWLPPDQIAAQLGKLGVSPNDAITLYDDGTGVAVGQMLGALDQVGHERIEILDGGITAWYHNGGELSRDGAGRDPVPYAFTGNAPSPTTKQFILENLDRDEVVFLDARSEAEYRGIDRQAARVGHIPGAAHLEWSDTLRVDERRVPFYRDDAELRDLLESRGVTPDKEVVCYCQSGIRSAQMYGVLRLLGYPRVRNYLASWGEWGNDPSTPIETD